VVEKWGKRSGGIDHGGGVDRIGVAKKELGVERKKVCKNKN